MSVCPRCHSNIVDGAKFCHKCGFKVVSVNKNYQPIKKLEWHNVSFKDMQNWLYNNSSNMIIENAKARIRFDEKGIFFTTYEWYFQDLIIWYRVGNNPSPNHLVSCYKSSSYLSVFAKKSVDNFINSQLAYSKRVMLDFSRQAYLPGGDLSFCRVALFN